MAHLKYGKFFLHFLVPLRNDGRTGEKLLLLAPLAILPIICRFTIWRLPGRPTLTRTIKPIPSVMPGRRWTTKENETLRRQIVGEHKEIDDVRIKNRTPHAVRTHAARLDLIRQRDSRYPWKASQKRKLKQLKAEGFTPLEIHDLDLLGEPYRSLWAIRKQWGRMKLSDRKRARRMREKKMWQAGEKQRFKEFLLAHSADMTPEEIGKEWNLARSTVARWQTTLGVKQPRETVMRMQYSVNKQRNARKKIRRQNVARAQRRRTEKANELVDLAQELRRRASPPPERVCTDCEESWPRRSEFFHYQDKRTDFGTTRRYKRRCRLCQNAIRRKESKRATSA